MLTFDPTSPQLIDKNTALTSTYWSGSDTLEQYNKNLNELGQDWEWANKTIEYNFNEFGHRSKSIKDLDKDFILCFGCSFTVGVGVQETQTWPHQLSRMFGLDYYNAGVGGAGMDICYYNSILWKANNLPLPGLVVVAWPEDTRKSFALTENNNILLDVSNQRSELYSKLYITDTAEQVMNNISWYEGFNSVWESLNIKVVNIKFNLLPQLDFLKIPSVLFDSDEGSGGARDRMHDGPVYLENIAKKVMSVL
jgi:hypothetical protein